MEYKNEYITLSMNKKCTMNMKLQHLWDLLMASYKARIDESVHVQISSWFAIAVVISDQ